jgi:hypothetical protein
MDFSATDNLSRLVVRKHGLLVQMRDVGRQQLALIAGGDMTLLLKLLASKQRLLGVLHGVERELSPFRREDPERRLWRNAADRQRCAELAEQCNALLAEVVQVEQRSESQMRSRRDEAATRLEGIHHAAQVRHAYVPHFGAAEPRQLDLSSGG